LDSDGYQLLSIFLLVDICVAPRATTRGDNLFPESGSSPPKPIAAHALSRRDLRLSLYLPVLITLLIFGSGVVIYLLVPREFNVAIGLVVTLGLLAYLIVATRRSPLRLRVIAVLIALPALVGISVGMINGRLSLTLIGIAVTFVLLILYRAFNTPISYRFALRAFQQGDMRQALDLVERAIAARPEFWESYQLRPLIFLAGGDFPRAERSAKEAIAQKPGVHSLHNIVGQVYLAQNKFAKAQEAFTQALILDPNNPLYRFYLGLALYRQESFRAAAEVFVDATGSSIRYLEIELLIYYYLWHCFRELRLEEQQEEALAKMRPLAADGLPLVRRFTFAQPEAYAHAALLQADGAALDAFLKEQSADRDPSLT
jgi:Tfp pilus assembly protein PilF